MRHGLLDRFQIFFEKDPSPGVEGALEEHEGEGEGAGQPRRLHHPALEAQIVAQVAEGGGEGQPAAQVPVPAEGAAPALPPLEEPPTAAPEPQLPASEVGVTAVPPEGEPTVPTTEQRYEIGGRLRTPSEADEAFQHSRDEVDKWRQKAIEAEANARATTQLADTYAQQVTAQTAAPPPPDPFREQLSEAGIEPAELDRYLDRRMEQTLAGMGEQLNKQRTANLEAEQRVAELPGNEGFSRSKLDAFMDTRVDLKPAYEAAIEANLESGLTLGWNLLSAGGNNGVPTAAPVVETPSTVPPVPGQRRAIPPTQQKVGVPPPGTGRENQQKLDARAEELGWDTDDGKVALRSRFGGSLHPDLVNPPVR